MTKLLLSLVMGFVCLTAQADVVAPDALIKDTAQEVVSIVKQDKDIQSGNQKKILALVDAKVLPNFDFTRMTQLAVGKDWRRATPDQQKALVSEFRNMLVRTYTKAFTMYKDQTIDVKPLKLADTDTEAVVKTRILKSGGQGTSVDYKMVKRADGWKVYDVVIEAISMVTSYRSQFENTIQQSGIDGLIKELGDMNTTASNPGVRKAEAK